MFMRNIICQMPRNSPTEMWTGMASAVSAGLDTVRARLVLDLKDVGAGVGGRRARLANGAAAAQGRALVPEIGWATTATAGAAGEEEGAGEPEDGVATQRSSKGTCCITAFDRRA